MYPGFPTAGSACVVCVVCVFVGERGCGGDGHLELGERDKEGRKRKEEEDEGDERIRCEDQAAS